MALLTSMLMLACPDTSAPGWPDAATDVPSQPDGKVDDAGAIAADVPTPTPTPSGPPVLPPPPPPAAGTRDIAPGLELETDEGPVQGVVVGATRAFLGIRYAAAPTGVLRWRPPQPPPTHTDVFAARAFGPVCPQDVPGVSFDARSDEDCLRINVLAPNPPPAKPVPVMVWLHGGAYAFGSGGDSVYDGRALVEYGAVIVVTLNYRLGALGFLAHASLARESGTTGNYGLLDQRAALAWVRTNISAFGGNPDDVTLFGQSTGGQSVCAHLVSPGSRGLFHKAIVQSGMCMSDTLTRAEAEQGGLRFSRALGCEAATDVAACMRAAPARTIVETSRGPTGQRGGLFYSDYDDTYFLQPVADGVTLPDSLPRLFARGAAPTIPILHGVNSDEGVLFHSRFLAGSVPESEAAFRATVAVRFVDHVDAIVAQYAPPKSRSWNEALARVTGDAFFVCSARRLARVLRANGVPSYLYRFAGTLESLVGSDATGRSLHGAELPYLFSTRYAIGAVPFTYRPLAEALPGYWLRFAHTGDPNQPFGRRWEPYDASAREEFVFDREIGSLPLGSIDECTLWDGVASASPT